MMAAMTLPAVLLHGFGGTGRAWDAVRAETEAELVTPDLPGHGERSGERPVTFDGCVEAVLGEAPGQFVLGGYSMGGRVALHVALATPARVRGLLLAATTAGIDDAGERATRAAADGLLAERTAGGSIDDFIAEWTGLPLFARTPPEPARMWREDIARNSPQGLAAALHGIGTGVMEPLWARLRELPMPAVVLAGERDARYVELGRRIAAELPQGRFELVPDAGHGLPREAPAAVAGALAAVTAAATR